MIILNPGMPLVSSTGVIMTTQQSSIRTMIVSRVNEVINTVLEDGDELQPLKDALVDQFDAIVLQLEEQHAKELAKAKTESKKLKLTKPAAGSSGSGKSRAPNNYSLFIKVASRINQVHRDKHDVLANFEFTVTENFKEQSSKSASRYLEHRDQLLHNGEMLQGQTLTLAELYDVIVAAEAIDSGFKNGMTRAAIMWGLMSEESRAAVVALL